MPDFKLLQNHPRHSMFDLTWVSFEKHNWRSTPKYYSLRTEIDCTVCWTWNALWASQLERMIQHSSSSVWFWCTCCNCYGTDVVANGRFVIQLKKKTFQTSWTSSFLELPFLFRHLVNSCHCWILWVTYFKLTLKLVFEQKFYLEYITVWNQNYLFFSIFEKNFLQF